MQVHICVSTSELRIYRRLHDRTQTRMHKKDKEKKNLSFTAAQNRDEESVTLTE